MGYTMVYRMPQTWKRNSRTMTSDLEVPDSQINSYVNSHPKQMDGNDGNSPNWNFQKTHWDFLKRIVDFKQDVLGTLPTGIQIQNWFTTDFWFQKWAGICQQEAIRNSPRWFPESKMLK